MPQDHDGPTDPGSSEPGSDDHLHPHAHPHKLAPPHPDPYLPAARPGPKSAAVAAPGSDHDAPHTHAHSHEPPHAAAPAAPAAPTPPEEHRARAPRYAKVYVITCSDTRTEATDEGGSILRARLADHGHVHTGSAIVPDEGPRLLAELDRARKVGAQVVLITGGTGLSQRDATFEALQGVIARPLPGFGELFRMLSFAEVGAAAMLSRSCAGVCADGLVVFAMPGSPAAVRLACDRLILPELLHLVGELSR